MDQALPSEIQLSVVTPAREVVREGVRGVTVPGKSGYLGILPGHAPLLSELRAGEVGYQRSAGVPPVVQYLAVSRGFVEVLPERVIVLAEAAERAGEIDVERAQRAKQRAEERLRKITEPGIDQERARSALDRALTRLAVAARAPR
jgi:F-type H+-transporting ATPase subunit epsilon